jgi:two-component system, OmpR family, KDP operon response regulator KdpE
LLTSQAQMRGRRARLFMGLLRWLSVFHIELIRRSHFICDSSGRESAVIDGDFLVGAAVRTKTSGMANLIHVLLVDDDPKVLPFLQAALITSDYMLAAAKTASEAIDHIVRKQPEIVVLEFGLPNDDGRTLIRRIRERGDLPIIALSAHGREAEKIDALDLGADDFLTKPFGVGELMARMRAALRHRGPHRVEAPVLMAGNLMIDYVRHHVTRSGCKINLTPKEFELLSFVGRNAGRVVSHREIFEAVWGQSSSERKSCVRVYVGRLRRKIEADADVPKIIVTEPGGYRMAAGDSAI